MISATGKQAVTFIELIFVVIIIGVFMGVSFPKFRRIFNSTQLNSFSSQLQNVINYLSQRSIVEGKIIYFKIDNAKQEYYAWIEDETKKIRRYRIPDGIKIETSQEEILIYPDGSIDKIDIKVINTDNQNITLTTRGVFGGVKLSLQE